MRQMTVFVNLFQNLGSGYMKLLPEFQIESISAIEKICKQKVRKRGVVRATSACAINGTGTRG
jgi:hypothetical protein